MSDELHLDGAQVRAVVEQRAAREGTTFTSAVNALAEELSIGRETLFGWMRNGLPSRQNQSARREIVRLSQEMSP